MSVGLFITPVGADAPGCVRPPYAEKPAEVRADNDSSSRTVPEQR